MLEIKNDLLIKQKIELFEIFTGLETRNRYEIVDPESKESLFFAYEKSNFLWKFSSFFSNFRALTVKVIDNQKKELLCIKRNFAFFCPTYRVFSEKSLLGSLKKELAFFQRRYLVFDEEENKIFKIIGPFWKPWTFKVVDLRENSDTYEEQIALIGKKLSGLKELFTDADNFRCTISQKITDKKNKNLIFAASFAVDYDYFESK